MVGAATPDVRQRWRLTFAREAAPEGEAASGRDYTALWEAALESTGLPMASTDAGRMRFALGAPLPARTMGRAELADLWLTERVALWRIREALEGVLPARHRLVALEDIWLGAPALAGRVAAADYRVTLATAADAATIEAAAKRLLGARQIPRDRVKGGAVRTYDLRPLLSSIAVQTAPATADVGAPVLLIIRTRIHPELGSGRPEDVVAALADELGTPLEVVETIRERLVLADDL
jgi:radical SAM-linked protein